MTDAARTIALLDLTTLAGSETDAEIAALCRKAQSPGGDVAAVCVYPAFVARCARELDGTGIAVAAVANFPEGESDVDRTVADCAAAVDAGADEVDVVLPWRAFVEGDDRGPARVVRAAREATAGRVLKVILESGAHPGLESVRAAADLALAEGADFVKTSTGKHGQGATPAAARVMLEAIVHAGHGGFKASGGVRTAADADGYLALAAELLGPAWATPRTFRIGASGLLDALLDA